nr:MAG TPA: hypothetical protein [Bacteriophage sp.]
MAQLCTVDKLIYQLPFEQVGCNPKWSNPYGLRFICYAILQLS